MMFIFKKEMEVIKKCVSLIEGEIDTINFIQEFISNQNFEKYMKKAAKHNKTSFLTVEFVKENINLYTSFYNKYTIQSIVIRYLNQKRIPYNLRVRE